MNRYLKFAILFLVVVFIGIAIYFFATKSGKHSEMEHQNEVYTCSMHPEVIKDKPGSCPICGMTLVKKVTEDHSEKNDSINDLLKPTDSFVVGNYQTTTVKDTVINSEISLPGIVSYDPNSSVNISARISGRIEKMYVNYKYQKVTKGQKIFEIYSPELLNEQQNFIYLISNDSQNTSIINSAKQKLLLYGMSNNQVNTLASAKKVNPVIVIYSPANGIITGTEKMTSSSVSPMSNTSSNTETLDIKQGNYIKKGEVVFKLANTDKVWGIFNVLQGYNSLIKINQSIDISSELDEKNSIYSKINFVETQLNPTDKTNRIRVHLNNSTIKLPIGTRLQGVVQLNSTKGIWLQKQTLVSLGNKKVVFIKLDNGFKATAIQTGIEIDDFVQIIGGVSVGDTIAKNAQYLIDSESFIKTE
ncbi:Cu(I)/Ag(I) efflux system membrane fusion protein [Flavobacterium sp. 103]|uniref:Efflux RND transporter periplasmic adaptor subunit n=1 Tax=Flavobacterium aquariorum TaxID=2217670 RepID=A0A2W7TVF4_9FLAO|nr:MULTISPECIES: efflux RND transporter periplasmic adaptor subunit [Flavobacterium]PVX47542.1 Cu(I)/Ag(I) efflux system membrane fusion protein [Flavobacterium sp. 103]PZX93386.1 efflux RND transporter periplasmic adaptor subunit [Flavobacterium aquariorum]